MRARGLIVGIAIAAAFVAFAWDRLGIPFSTAEASFVHDAFREGGQVISPDFTTDPNHLPARVLSVIMQLVGCDERSLRLLFLLLILAAACVLSELLPEARVLTSAVAVIGMFFVESLSGLRTVRPEVLALLPASLALLAAPLSPPVTNLRAILALAGALGVGALSPHAAIVTAVVLAGVSIVRGTVLERATAIVTAAAGMAATWLVHGPDLHVSLGWSPFALDAIADARFLAGLVLVGALSLFFRKERRSEHVAVLAASIAALVAAAALAAPGVTADVRTGIFAAVPVLVLLLAVSADATGPGGRILIAIVLGGGLFLTARPSARDGDVLAILVEARKIALPQSALVISGEERPRFAVYARLGHAPLIPVIYVPEHATFANLAELCRTLSIRHVWPYPFETPPGFVTVESRPSALRSLIQLDLEGG